MEGKQYVDSLLRNLESKFYYAVKAEFENRQIERDKVLRELYNLHALGPQLLVDIKYSDSLLEEAARNVVMGRLLGKIGKILKEEV